MSTQSVGWAPSNPWFARGFEKAITKTLDEVTIKVLPLPYFLASKVKAFFDRGMTDVYASHDLEDITYLFNYTSDIDRKIIASESEVKQYLIEKLKTFRKDATILTSIRESLDYGQADERMAIIQERN